ncbi:hypothetical protein ACFVJ5_04645 [Nocardia sp. NPDC127606]|uniref:hypothetical protein n=1 Tax=Nocardia sp. NPDC127606 TaxID=3345406 RepID=UPI003630EADF
MSSTTPVRDDVPLVESLGADHIVARGDDVADNIRAIFPDGDDALADAALLHERVVPAVKDDGVFVSVRLRKGAPTRRIRFEAVLVNTEYHSSGKLDTLRALVEACVLTPRLA